MTFLHLVSHPPGPGQVPAHLPFLQEPLWTEVSSEPIDMRGSL